MQICSDLLHISPLCICSANLRVWKLWSGMHACFPTPDNRVLLLCFDMFNNVCCVRVCGQGSLKKGIGSNQKCELHCVFPQYFQSSICSWNSWRLCRCRFLQMLHLLLCSRDAGASGPGLAKFSDLCISACHACVHGEDTVWVPSTYLDSGYMTNKVWEVKICSYCFLIEVEQHGVFWILDFFFRGKKKSLPWSSSMSLFASNTFSGSACWPFPIHAALPASCPDASSSITRQRRNSCLENKIHI